MKGFLAVHRRGLAVCSTPVEIAVLVRLCERGNLYGWGQEFECPSSLVADWTVEYGKRKSPTWAGSFLTRMASVGVLEVTDPGHRHRKRRVRVFSPIPIHQRVHQRVHQDEGEKGDTDEVDTPVSTPTTKRVVKKENEMENEVFPLTPKGAFDEGQVAWCMANLEGAEELLGEALKATAGSELVDRAHRMMLLEKRPTQGLGGGEALDLPGYLGSTRRRSIPHSLREAARRLNQQERGE